MKFLDFNPKLVLVLDDCTDLLTKFKAHPVVQKLFYQGRWAFVTAIIACHTDKAFTPETKKNAFVSIFTEESCALAYFNRGTTDLGKEAKARATAACKQAFTPMLPYQKLAWVREEKKFYRFVATKHEPFCFGSDCFIEYCERIAIEKGAMPANNKFVGDFI